MPVVGRVTLTVRLVSSVRPPLVRVPVIVPASSVTEVMVGAFVAVVSTVTLKLPEAPEALPAISMTLALIV